VLEKLRHPHAGDLNLTQSLILYKHQLQWIKDLNLRPETTIRKHRGDTWQSTPKAQEAKIDKCDYIKLKNFCLTKETVNREKRQFIESENI
jgi:hypothetical protein